MSAGASTRDCRFYTDQMSVISDRLADLSDDDRPRVYMEFSIGRPGNTWSEQMWGALIRERGARILLPEWKVHPWSCSGTSDFGESGRIIFARSPRNDVSDNVVLGYGADEALAREHLEAYKNREGWADLDAVKTTILQLCTMI